MKKKIGFYTLIFIAVMAIGTLFTSCLNDNYCCDRDSMISFGVIEKNGTGNQDYVIHLDSGDDVVPEETAVPSFETTDNQRVLVNFSPLSDEDLTDSTLIYTSRINALRNILYKGIKKYTEVADDSMGHDPIIIRDAWISKTGDILNIDLKYYTEGSIHYINLIDNGEANGITNPFVLELRHNARGDQKDYPAVGFVSFKLDYLKLAGKNETKFVIRYTDYEGRRIDIPKTYRY